MLRDVHRRLGIALATAVVAAPAPGAAEAADGCRAADAEAAGARGSALRAALVCLVNRERGAHGLPALHRDRSLSRAAGRHARDMARRRYFAHQRGGGPDLTARVRRAGWRGSGAGETIGFGCGAAATPRAVVQAWMNSSPHRALILSGAFGRAGPGLARRAPPGCDGGVTWVLDLGAPRLP